MSGPWTRRRRGWAWLVGCLVLAALGIALHSMFSAQRARPGAARAVPKQAEPSAAPPPGVAAAKDANPVGSSVGGVVVEPDGRPAAGATVVVYRALTGWPEWQRERIDQAITGPDGAFQFRVAQRYGLLVGFEHPSFAGGLEDVPPLPLPLRLQLQPGFELFGVVTNASGAAVVNAEVAIESVLSEQRRAQSVRTEANGGYRFTNLPAGTVRLVARHDAWQPVAVPLVVVGDQVRRDLSFERQALAPLRGRVTSAVSQAPVAGALVELLPANGRPGLLHPISVRTAADGTFLLSGLPRSNMRVLVRHPEHGAFSKTLAVGIGTADLAFELPPRSLVHGQLVTDDARPLFVGGEVLQVRDSYGQLDYAIAGTDGRFRFAVPLSPGLASIVAVDGHFAFQRTQAREAAVRIEEAGRTDVELAIERPNVLRGRIVDEAGRPLGGARISRTKVLAESARSIGSALEQLDIGSLGSQFAQLFRDDRDDLLATSDADGRFEIRSRPPGPLLVRFVLAGHGGRWMRVTVPGGKEPGDLGDVVLSRGCKIQGRVLRGGRGLAGASVTVEGPECQAMLVTGRDGVFLFEDLPVGQYRVRGRLPTMPTGSREKVVLTAPGRTPPDVVLVLDAGRTVRGIVNGSDGQPVPGAIVTVRGAVGQTAMTESGGEFLLELPDRAIDLQVALADRSRQSLVSVPLGQQRVVVRLDTPPTCTLVAQVAGLPGKKRLPGALLRFTSLDGNGEAQTRSRWADLQNGELRWSLCPVGRVRVQVWSDGYAPFVTEREFVANDEHNLGEILLEPGGRLLGQVVDEAGAPVANAVVWLGEETDIDLFEPKVRSAADGTFRLTGVTGRSSRLVARATGYAPRAVDLVLPQDVLSGVPVVVTLERGATIGVSVGLQAETESILVQLRQRGRVLATTEPDETGRAWFPNRSAGTYTVHLIGSDIPPKDVVVAAGMSVVRVHLP